MPFEWLKLLHVGSALLSISGFGLRGYWMLTGDPRLLSRPARLLPHILDTLLLASAVGMLVMLRVNPLALPWLSAKIAALLCYIGLGMVAFRFGKSRRVRATAFGMALLTAAYIVAVAVSRSPLGPLAVWPG